MSDIMFVFYNRGQKITLFLFHIMIFYDMVCFNFMNIIFYSREFCFVSFILLYDLETWWR